VGQLHPNPFSTTATLDILLPVASSAEITIYDVAGRAVRTIAVADSGGRSRSVSFDGRDGHGRLLANGVYFARVRANGMSITRKMVIAR
jgi:flagellar hook assembly protein FlgD